MPDSFLVSLMQGYLSGDGHFDEANNRWRLGFTENDEWAADLRTLAARLDASLTLKRTTVDGFGKKWPAWRGEWRWTSTVRYPRNEVVAIRASRARQFFDVGVADEPHLFALASGVLTHNSKPNGLPESVTDRVRRSHEQWFHLTKEPRYFAAVDEVREAHATEGGKSYADRLRDGQVNTKAKGNRGLDAGSVGMPSFARSPLGKLPGSVWTIPSEPLKVPDWLGVDHFAAFPQEWPRRIILGWSPSGICTACGEGRRPVVEKEYVKRDNGKPNRVAGYTDNNFGGPSPLMRDGTGSIEATITGYACACDDTSAPTRPAVVLDPFGGTGTVAMVARALGRYPVHLDLSADYLKLARWRIYESGHASKTAERTNRERQGVLL
jgi:hypothetical protein